MVGRANDGLDFFPTPAETAKAMIDAADIQGSMAVLEPSAGMGHIAEQIRDVSYLWHLMLIARTRCHGSTPG